MFKRMKHPFDPVLMDNSKYGFLSTIKNELFCVSVYFTQILIKDAVFMSPKTGKAFYIAKKSYQMSRHLQGKHSGPGDRTHDIPLCSQAL